jgi:hypothetical protein
LPGVLWALCCGGEEWLRDQCIIREAAGGGRALGLIRVVEVYGV